MSPFFSFPQYNNSSSMCIPSFKILATVVPEKTGTHKKKNLQTYGVTELRTDQIQYSLTFQSADIIIWTDISVKVTTYKDCTAPNINHENTALGRPVIITLCVCGGGGGVGYEDQIFILIFRRGLQNLV